MEAPINTTTAAASAASAAAATTGIDSAAALKRKRTPSVSSSSLAAPAAKSAKTTTQLSINYLARQSTEDLPLITKDDTLPNLLHLLSSYSNILDRHESLASNLGARPLGPILIKRFERCFDAPPTVVASHHKGAASNPDDSPHSITWLEVIEFARSHPGQFTLSSFSEGRRVCQFYYPQKQLRVQVSEEDYLFINSGRCQELIPPLPIWEDEEKEVGTCDVLESKLKELTNAADMVAARTRQLSHRLKGRRTAILERRAEGGSGTPAKAGAIQTTTAPTSNSASASGSGFPAVNTAVGKATPENGEPQIASSAAVRIELLRHFESLPHNQGQGRSQSRHQSFVGATDSGPSGSGLVDSSHLANMDGAMSNTSSLSPVPHNLSTHDGLPYTTPEHYSARPQGESVTYGHGPSSSTGHNLYNSGGAPGKHNFSRPLPPALESTQPFRPLCQAHMDALPRGHRVLPPCDRCRRLRMDCVKNLTSCAGCTRKHARCHWRDVSRNEVGALDHLMESAYPTSVLPPAHSPNQLEAGYTNGYSYDYNHHADGIDELSEESDDDDSNPLEDLEALGEKEEQETRIREDEEGLRQARELSKQGWEGSVRTVAPQPSLESGSLPASEPTAQKAVENGDADVKPLLADTELTLLPAGNAAVSSLTAKRASYDPVHELSARTYASAYDLSAPACDASALAAPHLPATHGGFRAVNE